MARPVWNGVISFGLLNVPVQLYTAAKNVDLHFRMLDARNKKPIRYERVNAETGDEVPWKEIVKAFEYSKGNYVVVDEKEIRKLAPEATESVDIETFVDQTAIDPMFFEKPYYLVPVKKAEKGYVLLREALKKTGKVAIARVVIRTRQYLAMMFPKDDALVLNLLRFPQEIVEQDEFAFPTGALTKFRITAAEMKMAEDLLKSMAGKWAPTDYKDEFRDKLRKMIQQRVDKEQGTLTIPHESEEATDNATTNVVDFVSLLKKSLSGKSGGTKTAAKKTPAKRARAHARRKRA
ncbi:MAG TPA: Ku protein [Rudaea sp.]|jgi:DNA end-binding protein Ku|nr:Ku protein [Rudaea sp.]